MEYKNTYTKSGAFIVDSLGRYYAVDAWHPMPLPDGIIDNPTQRGDRIIYGGAGYPAGGAKPTRWLARSPVPEYTGEITQEERDEIAFIALLESNGAMSDRGFFMAGIKHAREQKQECESHSQK